LLCITTMLDYSIEHLEYEEQILKDNDYPDSISHSIIHQFYVKKVENYLKVPFSKNNNLKNEALAFLKDWWTYHILEEDMKYRPFLESRKLV
ncbi:MAG: hemerythrin family protein, partial [Gammaproteobacteria bacterium]|nr:hemerythrin family protein [Gammaproteobacteria bacterium]